jgi:ferredoxin like protein
MVTVEERLSLVRYNVDTEAHIKVDKNICQTCPHKACTILCPAGCFTISEELGVLFSYGSCLECGTCNLVCDQEAITWNYPRGGFGVSFRFT